MKRIFFFSPNRIRLLSVYVLPALLIIMSAAIDFRAQNFERGNSSELKGLTKLFINARGDVERQKLIVEQIEKAKIPGLTIVDSREDAEIVIRFGGNEKQVLQDISTNEVIGTEWTMTTVDRRMVRSGRGLVFIASKDKKLPRIIMTFGDVQDSAFEKRPVIRFAKKFIKAYKEANGLN